jgi:hypothetical protein
MGFVCSFALDTKDRHRQNVSVPASPREIRHWAREVEDEIEHQQHDWKNQNNEPSEYYTPP